MHSLFLASAHGLMHETNDCFYFIITFSYTKYFVHSYTVDVVFTLSYLVCPYHILRHIHSNPQQFVRCFVLCV